MAEKPRKGSASTKQLTLGSFFAPKDAGGGAEKKPSPPTPSSPKRRRDASKSPEPKKKAKTAKEMDILGKMKSKGEQASAVDSKATDDLKEAVEQERQQDEDEELAKDSAKVAAKIVPSAPKTGGKIGKHTFEKIDGTTKRLQIMGYLTEFLGDVMLNWPRDLLPCIYLCLNRICPEYEGKELGLGESILIKAIAEATGRTPEKVKADLHERGDLGAVAQASKGVQKSVVALARLKVPDVFKTLKEIAFITGGASQKKKIDLIKKMLAACQGSEPKYLIRSLEGKLRIGLAEQSVLQSLAHASVLRDPAIAKWPEAKRVAALEEAVATVKQVYSELPTYDKIVPVLLEKGVGELAEFCKMEPGIPLKPMLAHPTKAISEVLDRFEGMTFTCEYKYDGERAQIHYYKDEKDNDVLKIFSRNSEDLSAKYPDVIERLHKIPKETVTSFVLDAECVAWDREQKCILPFQVLSTRKRKDVQTADIQVQVCIFAFDLIYLNGNPLTRRPLKERRELLHEHFNEVEGEFSMAKYKDTNSVEEIQSFLDDAVEGNCEGLMVKTLEQEASYEPSKRSRNWLKVKKDYLSGAGDSLDLVVIGGYIGKGKRTGWYGGYLLACYDDDKEEYQAICKIGTGFSEENLAEHAKFFKDHIIDKPKPYYCYGDNPNVRPDVWFDPVQVWEVKAADLSISPVHKAALGLVDNNKGISLRFPRFIRVRDDKNPEQATTSTQVAEFYRNQKINNASGKGAVNDDDW